MKVPVQKDRRTPQWVFFSSVETKDFVVIICLFVLPLFCLTQLLSEIPV